MKKITEKTLEKLLEKSKTDNIETIKIGEVDGNDVSIEVKKSLSMDEFYGVCAGLSTIPFTDSDDGVSVYIPSAEVTGLRIALLAAYVPNLMLPDDIVDAYQLCSSLNLFQKVHNVLKDKDMYNDLLAIADKYSEYHRLQNSGLSLVEKALSSVDIGDAINNLLLGFTEQLQNTDLPVMDSTDA